jgi:hypothetical protein
MKRGLIDYVKVRITGIDVIRLLNHEKLDFNCEYSHSTGQLHEEKMVAIYHICKITIITKKKAIVVKEENTFKEVQHVLFTGSIHKMWNSICGITAPNYSPEKVDKGFNGNEFTILDVQKVRQHLVELFDCTTEQMVFQNIELGVNIVVDFVPTLFLNNLLYHNSKLFDYMHNRNSAQVKHNRYILKIYNKSYQYGMPDNVLRVELKFMKMEDLKVLGIQTFSDIEEKTLHEAHLLLVERFGEVMAYDDSIRKRELSKHAKSMLPKYSNPNYWIRELKPNHRDRHKKALRVIIANHSNNRQKLIRDLLAKECVINNQSIEDSACVINNTSDIVLKTTQLGVVRGQTEAVINIRVCPITGMDISMQKESSTLLSYNGLRHYLHFNPKLFEKIKHIYLTDYWSGADLTTQIKE